MRLVTFKSSGLAQYVVAGFLSLLLAVLVLQLWRANLHVPLEYKGDALLHCLLVKSVHDNNWYLDNPRVGMPYGFNFRDFPTPDNFHWLLFRLLFIFVSDWGLGINLFYIFTFPAITIASLFAMRRLGVSYAAALVGSLLYTFLPYHFYRGISHLLLSAYYTVPLISLVIIWLCRGEKIIWVEDKTTLAERLKIVWRLRKAVFTIVLCLLMGGTGAVYYPFFAAFLILVAGLIAWWQWRCWQVWVTPVLLVGIISASVLVNVAPSLLYARQYGKLQVQQRQPEQAETYGLKLAQMLLPIADHRLKPFAALQEAYRENRPLVNENYAVALGLICGAGFIFLILGMMGAAAGVHEYHRSVIGQAIAYGVVGIGADVNDAAVKAWGRGTERNAGYD